MAEIPKITYCMKKASAEKEIMELIEEAFNARGLPHFMRVDILRGALVAEQQRAYSELANDSEAIMRQTTEYFEKKIKELSKAAEEEKKALIEAFENPVSPDPEGECSESTERSD